MPQVNIDAQGMNTLIMKMVNLKHYIGVSLFSLLLLFTGNSLAMSNTKFEWDATESAPKHYPMKIIQGTFIYHGETSAGLYIPSGGNLKAGWGKAISSHVTGDKYKPLPDRLEIIFFSYAEKQFYKGEFDLPYEKILMLFQEKSAEEDGHPVYSRIMAGIAPGGVVAVWAKGFKTTEVFFGQAEKVELNTSAAFGVPFDSKQESDTYISEVMEGILTPDELESLKKDGVPFGLWSRYRNRYDWLPVFTQGRPEYINTIFVNGENDRRWYLTEKIELNNPRAVPSRMSFHSMVKDKKALYTVTFDEFETMDAFEKLGANGKKVYMEFEPRLPRENIKVRLYNDKESIELKKFVSKP